MAESMPHKKELLAFLDNLENQVILDYGCGKGDFIELILNHKPLKIHAVDSNSSTISKIKSRFKEQTINDRISIEITTDPNSINEKFNKIICHNVLECVEDKIGFVNKFNKLLLPGGVFLLSHHDFDSAIYNSSDEGLTRNLIHNFADTKQKWQEYSDGKMGRKIPGIIEKSVFKDSVCFFIMRKMERSFSQGNYGHLMANMISKVVKGRFEEMVIKNWYEDLTKLSRCGDYYFTIDLVVAIMNKPKL